VETACWPVKMVTSSVARDGYSEELEALTNNGIKVKRHNVANNGNIKPFLDQFTLLKLLHIWLVLAILFIRVCK